MGGEGGKISPRSKAARRDTRIGLDAIWLGAFFLFLVMMRLGYFGVIVIGDGLED